MPFVLRKFIVCVSQRAASIRIYSIESIVMCGLMTEGHATLHREIYRLCTKIIMVHSVSFNFLPINILFVYFCTNSVSTHSSTGADHFIFSGKNKRLFQTYVEQ